MEIASSLSTQESVYPLTLVVGMQEKIKGEVGGKTELEYWSDGVLEYLKDENGNHFRGRIFNK